MKTCEGLEKRTGLCTSLVFIAGLMLASWPGVSCAETLVLGGYEKIPYMMQDGEQPGFCVEIFRETAKRAGFDTQYTLLPTKRMLEDFRNRVLDAEPCCSPTWRQADEAISIYSEPYYHTENVVFVRKDSGIKAQKVEDFQGKRLGCGLGYFYTDGFQEAFEKGMIVRDDVSNAEMNVRKLAARRIDGMIADRTEGWYLMKQQGLKLEDFDVAYVFQTKSALSIRIHKEQEPFMLKLNEALKAMKADGTLEALIKKYTE